MLKRERTKASKRLAKKSKNRETAGQARLTLALKTLTQKLSSKPSRKPPDDLEHRRRRDVKALELNLRLNCRRSEPKPPLRSDPQRGTKPTHRRNSTQRRADRFGAKIKCRETLR